jgi:hypothetical protein
VAENRNPVAESVDHAAVDFDLAAAGRVPPFIGAFFSSHNQTTVRWLLIKASALVDRFIEKLAREVEVLAILQKRFSRAFRRVGEKRRVPFAVGAFGAFVDQASGIFIGDLRSAFDLHYGQENGVTAGVIPCARVPVWGASGASLVTIALLAIGA